jgi:hypothetical protein
MADDGLSSFSITVDAPTDDRVVDAFGPAADPVVNAVCGQILSRSRAGIRKYGTTMARDDLSRADWLRHAQEELLDGAIYIERLYREEVSKAAAALPSNPPIGLLMCMAVRRDPFLARPGYYNTVGAVGAEGRHAQRVRAAIQEMRAVYAEVAGRGEYSAESEGSWHRIYSEAVCD